MSEERVDHPEHYNRHPSGVECIDVVEEFSFNVGNAVKYLWRAGLKGPDPLEDLRKAAWYVGREIERLSRGGGHDRSGAGPPRREGRSAGEEARDGHPRRG